MGKKRPTRTKVKGCYECSQRRISCDRAQPACKKCELKGLVCSGLGIRYRFEDSMASRGKLAGKTMEEVLSSKWGFVVKPDRSNKPPPASREITQMSELESRDHRASPLGQNSLHKGMSDNEYAKLNRDNILSSIISTAELLPENGANGSTISIQPLASRLNILSSRKLFLLSYFSDHIAPQMLSIDDGVNEWRSLVLPISVTTDEVVLYAVLATAAHHMCTKAAWAGSIAKECYSHAIEGLSNRRELTSLDRHTNECNILTILVLLVSAQVSGSSDFPFLFKMLEAAIVAMDNEGGLGNSELAGFLMRQVKKFRVYAKPLISEDDGIKAITHQARQSFDCLRRCADLHPEYAPGLANIRSQIEQAYNVYLLRASCAIDRTKSVQLVERFIQTAQAFPEGCPGEQVLVWSSFILAAESSNKAHQTYLMNRLKALHLVNGFINVVKAQRLVQKIWEDNTTNRWTEIVAQANIFIM